ncbi:hypothetical protein [Novosphingobium sp. KA1]|uniref:hypothetical protein n=1 Tax=Novosphingobium sp. (strain KA1) TaxID=164608 RepID=UPI00159ECC03|nr:hypothetical protein [Novosphingobium sp. KA1]
MGAVAGGLIVIYVIGKITEWAAWKRIFESYRLMVWVSSIAAFAIIFALWFSQRNKVYAFNPAMFIDYAIAGIVLPIIRTIWRNRREAKANRSER